MIWAFHPRSVAQPSPSFVQMLGWGADPSSSGSALGWVTDFVTYATPLLRL